MTEQEIKMALERQFADAFGVELSHYASPYYDPVKAHEYYMAHRELKGRQASKLNDEGKEIWSETKENITSEKKEKVEDRWISKRERDHQK